MRWAQIYIFSTDKGDLVNMWSPEKEVAVFDTLEQQTSKSVPDLYSDWDAKRNVPIPVAEPDSSCLQGYWPKHLVFFSFLNLLIFKIS